MKRAKRGIIDWKEKGREGIGLPVEKLGFCLEDKKGELVNRKGIKGKR